MIFIFIILCFILLIIIEFVLEKKYMQTDEYKRSLGGAAKLNSVPHNIEICNVGSGPSLYGISYEYTDKNGFNFGTAPQNFEYAFKLLKHFKANINEGAIVIITVMCPMSFGNNRDFDRRDYSDKFYGILNPDEIIGYNRMRKIKLRHPLLVKCINKVKNKFKTNIEINNNDHIKSSETNIVRVWEEEFKLENLNEYTYSIEHEKAAKSKVDILNNEIEFCYNNNWIPIIVIPPVPSQTRKSIGLDFLNRFFGINLNKLKEKQPLVPVLNYYDDSRFTDDLFNNDIFLNVEGQAEFSKILFDDINVNI